MAVLYGNEFGITDVTELIRIWKTVMGENWDTAALRASIPNFLAELEDGDPNFPQIAARAVYKKGKLFKPVYDQVVETLAERFNGYAQVAAVYPDIVDTMNYLGIIESMTTRHDEMAAERRKQIDVGGDHWGTRNQSVWKGLGIANHTSSYAQ